MKSLIVLYAFSSAVGCTKNFKFERIWLFKHTPMMRRMKDFSYFSKKKQQFSVNYCFFWKIRKIINFLHHGRVWRTIILSNLSFWYNQRMKKHLKHSNFSFFFLSFLVYQSNNIRNFRQKRPTFLRKNFQKGVKHRQGQISFFWCLEHYKKFIWNLVIFGYFLQFWKLLFQVWDYSEVMGP